MIVDIMVIMIGVVAVPIMIDMIEERIKISKLQQMRWLCYDSMIEAHKMTSRQNSIYTINT